MHRLSQRAAHAARRDTREPRLDHALLPLHDDHSRRHQAPTPSSRPTSPTRRTSFGTHTTGAPHHPHTHEKLRRHSPGLFKRARGSSPPAARSRSTSSGQRNTTADPPQLPPSLLRPQPRTQLLEHHERPAERLHAHAASAQPANGHDTETEQRQADASGNSCTSASSDRSNAKRAPAESPSPARRRGPRQRVAPGPRVRLPDAACASSTRDRTTRSNSPRPTTPRSVRPNQEGPDHPSPQRDVPGEDRAEGRGDRDRRARARATQDTERRNHEHLVRRVLGKTPGPPQQRHAPPRRDRDPPQEPRTPDPVERGVRIPASAP